MCKIYYSYAKIMPFKKPHFSDFPKGYRLKMRIEPV